MIGKQVLLHWPLDCVKPTGGPAGYLFNLKQGLEEVGVEGYSFLPAKGKSLESNTLLQKIVPSRIKDYRRAVRLLSLAERQESAPVDYGLYSAIHFHSTEDLYLHKDALAAYRGIVLLTSHSPCVYHKELISRLNPIDANRFKDELKSLEQIDEVAFERADYIIFPCKEAEEPYAHTWDSYAKYRNAAKIRYLPTGIQQCSAKENRDVIRKRFGIPNDALLMCYVGRHNEIKGYDSLVELALPILADPNVWMLVAGKQGPLYAPKHKRWIEVGWTDDPHSLIASSDIFLLPNRETYFDLVLLEVLSLGTPVAASRTGGNKYFEQFNLDGLMLYTGEVEFANVVRRILSLTGEERNKIREDNRRLFLSEFTCSKFAKRYCSLVSSLLHS